MNTEPRILRVAVATPLRRLFDYLPAKDSNLKQLVPGLRVSISFGRRKETVGLIMDVIRESDYPLEKLKSINCVLDTKPVVDLQLLKLITWASQYYHHPIGDVAFNALPVWLRKANSTTKLQMPSWRLTKSGSDVDPNTLTRAPKQAQVINYLQQIKTACDETQLLSEYPGILPVLKKLAEKGWLEKTYNENADLDTEIQDVGFKLNQHQRDAIEQIVAAIGSDRIFLLDGLTGSGKTEVYMAAIEHALKENKQSLVLLPEIGLTPQLIQRFQQRFNCPIAVQHSGLTDLERARYWMDAKNNRAKIILGTRSAVWTPLASPGIFIVDEEHDLSYKQQDGLRYSARDLLLVRAQHEQVPVVLGSATPSMESLYNVNRGKYQQLVLPARAGNANLPTYKLIDIRGKKMHGALSQTLVDDINSHLQQDNQVLLFLNRRGYANHLICHACGWKANCERCELPYTYHKSRNRLICHHCDTSKQNIALCPDCATPLVFIGHGTERIEEVLQQLFPDKTIARIDRDTTRQRDALDSLLKQIHAGEVDILIGTQMLAKGHHFPNVTLTAIIDADRGLFSTDFRASERLAQLFIQVSGRSGRGNKPGTVVVQTHNPEHPLFQQLIKHGYAYYAKQVLEERKLAGLPPCSYMALLTAEAHNSGDSQYFLNQAAAIIKPMAEKKVSVFGPIPALIEKRSGRYRMQLILQADDRKLLHHHLDNWLLQLETMKLSKKVRWSFDIDPLDMA